MAADPNQKKVVVNFQSVANAPKLRQSKFKGVIQMIPLKEKLEVIRQCCPKIYSNQIISAQIGGNEKFAKVIEFLRRQIHQDTVFLYVNSAFSPNPDELIMDLYNNFGIDGQLVVNYASSLAWG